MGNSKTLQCTGVPILELASNFPPRLHLTPTPSILPPPQNYLALWDTLCSCEAYGMRSKYFFAHHCNDPPTHPHPHATHTSTPSIPNPLFFGKKHGGIPCPPLLGMRPGQRWTQRGRRWPSFGRPLTPPVQWWRRVGRCAGRQPPARTNITAFKEDERMVIWSGPHTEGSQGSVVVVAVCVRTWDA